jgi:hypothetical protein
MSSSSTITTRKTRATTVISNVTDGSPIFDDFHTNLRSPIEFINLYNQYFQSLTHRSTLINILSNILTLENVDKKILLFILDCFITNSENLSDIQFKQDLLPFIKQILITNDENNNDILLSTIRLLIVFVEYRPNILTLTLAEWLSCLLNFLVTHLSSTTYTTYADLIIDLLSKIVKQFTPLSKEIIDILGRSPSSVISTSFLNQLKLWIQNTDDIRLALFAIHLWQLLASLLSRLLLRGHTKGNEMLAVIEDGEFAY